MTPPIGRCRMALAGASHAPDDELRTVYVSAARAAIQIARAEVEQVAAEVDAAELELRRRREVRT